MLLLSGHPRIKFIQIFHITGGLIRREKMATGVNVVVIETTKRQQMIKK